MIAVSSVPQESGAAGFSHDSILAMKWPMRHGNQCFEESLCVESPEVAVPGDGIRHAVELCRNIRTEAHECI